MLFFPSLAGMKKKKRKVGDNPINTIGAIPEKQEERDTGGRRGRGWRLFSLFQIPDQAEING